MEFLTAVSNSPSSLMWRVNLYPKGDMEGEFIFPTAWFESEQQAVTFSKTFLALLKAV